MLVPKAKKVKFHFIVNIQCLCIIIQITYFFVEVFCIRFYNVRLRMQSRSSHKKLSVIVIISVTWCLFHYINDFRYRPNIYKSLYKKCCWATLIFCTLVVQYSATKQWAKNQEILLDKGLRGNTIISLQHKNQAM